LLINSKARKDEREGVASRQARLRSLSLLNLVILIATVTALTAWYAFFRAAGSDKVQTVAPHP
jgi:hypothetical protein